MLCSHQLVTSNRVAHFARTAVDGGYNSMAVNEARQQYQKARLRLSVLEPRLHGKNAVSYVAHRLHGFGIRLVHNR